MENSIAVILIPYQPSKGTTTARVTYVKDGTPNHKTRGLQNVVAIDERLLGGLLSSDWIRPLTPPNPKITLANREPLGITLYGTLSGIEQTADYLNLPLPANIIPDYVSK